MSLSQTIQSKIKTLEPGAIFSAKILGLPSTPTVRKTLSRLESEQLIERIQGAQGLYFTPIQGAYSTVGPGYANTVKALLKVTNGYLSGFSLYNQLGLTTQVPGIVVIACSRFPRSTIVDRLKVQYKKARVEVTADNKTSLQYLDVLMNVKNIPGASPSTIVKKMKIRLANLKGSDLKKLVGLSKKYPKRVQALLGATLESIKTEEDIVRPLRQVTSTGSVFKLGIENKILPGKDRWNIQ